VPLADHKTKIVATIGPASESPQMLERLIRAGMNIARLNFSHGDFTGHAGRIARIRAAEQATGLRVAIMADLPGPKMRLGVIEPEPIQLCPGDPFTLTSDDIVGNAQRASMSFEQLPRVVKPGNRLFLNDGLVNWSSSASRATMSSARSRSAVNYVPRRASICRASISASCVHRPRPRLPGIRARTRRGRREPVVRGNRRGRRCRAAAANAIGRQPFIIAKIERAEPSTLRRDSAGGRRHHGGARRSRVEVPLNRLP
jgi:pyruvate kinase